MNYQQVSSTYHQIGSSASNTNIKLQMVIYFGLQYIIQQHGLTENVIRAIYSRPFYVWRYGPIEPQLYEQFKCFEGGPITEATAGGQLDSQLHFLDDHLVMLLTDSTNELIHRSHEEPYWQAHQSDIVGWRSSVAYSIDDIKN